MASSTVTIRMIDDGTMDRVYHCHCEKCDEEWSERFSAMENEDGEWSFPSESEALETIEEAHADFSPCYE